MQETDACSGGGRLPVKVLYTLDSHPNSTLVASLGRPTPVQVVSFGRREGEGKAGAVFGKVTLKTCLSAICIARWVGERATGWNMMTHSAALYSPELMIDRRQDYILYAVDPIESYLVSQRRGSASTSTSTRAPDSGSKGKGKGPGAEMGEKERQESAFVVGKGFFTWALAESGDGQSLVHGRLRSEFGEDEDDRAGSSDEDNGESLEGKVLEVSLRLKAASSTSRDQYFDRVKSFQPSSATAPSHSLDAVSDHVETGVAQSLRKRERESSPGRLKGSNRMAQSASSPVTASEREHSQAGASTNTNTPAQQQLLHFLQALQAQAASPTSQGTPIDVSQASHKQQPAQVWPHPAVSSHKTGGSGMNAASPEVISHLLRSLAAPSPSTTRQDRSPHLGQSTALPSHTAPSMNKIAPAESAASPILGGLTPGYEVDYLSGPSPAAGSKASVPVSKSAEADGGEVKSKSEAKEASVGVASGSAKVKQRLVGSHRSKQCCYNCGLRSQRSWRHLALADTTLIRFQEGSITYDHGKRLHRACNACGLYFNKYNGISRPEHVWKEAHRQKREQRKETENKHGDKCKCSTGEERALSPFEVWGEDTADDEGVKKLESSAVARTKQIARTLSEACERDINRRMSVCGESESDQDAVVGSAPARRVANFEEARLKDYVEDSEGVWRTKRSILENPENRRPGRPKGSKTGKGEGRPRERHLLARNRQQEQAAAKSKARPMTASSPGAEPAAKKGEKRARTAAAPWMAPQSSPVRPSMVGGAHAKTPGSTMTTNRARYGAPNYLLDSSPATAFQTVLNEAETDWNALCGLSPRRSPRKNPHGTHSGLNPYASAAASPGSRRNQSTQDLMKMTSSSPLTRSRVKSGQYHLDDVWFSSEGFEFGDKKTSSSSLTSPGSPSPSPAHLKNRGVKRKSRHVMLQAGQVQSDPVRSGGENGTLLTPEKARKAARQARQAQAAVPNSVVEDAVVDAGPFMGLGVAETSVAHGDDEDEEEAGRGSPTAGRSRRMGQRSSGPSVPSDLDAFSMQASPSSAGVMLDFQQDWTRSTSMRELFPTPSPIKQWTNHANSPSTNALWQSPTSWALKPPTPSPVKTEMLDEQPGKAQSGTALMELDRNAPHQLIRRKPLPATVEDASSSVNSASSSPMEEEEDDEGGNGMDLLEDPYGLLAASGIGVQGDQPGLSMEDFDSIELFKSVDFHQQLDFFTQMGSNGVAAHLAPSHEAAHSSTLKIEGKGKLAIGGDMEVQAAAGAASPSAAGGVATATADFAALLKDPAMQAILAHMQLSPSKPKPLAEAEASRVEHQAGPV